MSNQSTIPCSDFDNLVRTTPIVILTLTSQYQPLSVPAGAMDYFRRAYGDACGFATVSLNSLPYAKWLDPIVTPVGRRACAIDASGFYLLLGGKPVAYLDRFGGSPAVALARLVGYADPGERHLATALLGAFDPLARAHASGTRPNAPLSAEPIDARSSRSARAHLAGRAAG